MANFDLEALIFSASTLSITERVTVRFLGGYPGTEKSGGVKGGLEVTDDLIGGDQRRLVDGFGKAAKTLDVDQVL